MQYIISLNNQIFQLNDNFIYFNKIYDSSKDKETIFKFIFKEQDYDLIREQKIKDLLSFFNTNFLKENKNYLQIKFFSEIKQQYIPLFNDSMKGYFYYINQSGLEDENDFNKQSLITFEIMIISGENNNSISEE